MPRPSERERFKSHLRFFASSEAHARFCKAFSPTGHSHKAHKAHKTHKAHTRPPGVHVLERAAKAGMFASAAAKAARRISGHRDSATPKSGISFEELDGPAELASANPMFLNPTTSAVSMNDPDPDFLLPSSGLPTSPALHEGMQLTRAAAPSHAGGSLVSPGSLGSMRSGGQQPASARSTNQVQPQTPSAQVTYGGVQSPSPVSSLDSRMTLERAASRSTLSGAVSSARVGAGVFDTVRLPTTAPPTWGRGWD